MLTVGGQELPLAAVALANTAPYNMARVPAISVPSGTTSAGLSIGFQIAGRPLNEATVLRAAHAYEQAVVSGEGGRHPRAQGQHPHRDGQWCEL